MRVKTFRGENMAAALAMIRQELGKDAVILGTLAVLLIPAARGHHEWLGWLPLWLVGMPLSAWWSLRGFPVPALALPAIILGGIHYKTKNKKVFKVHKIMALVSVALLLLHRLWPGALWYLFGI